MVNYHLLYHCFPVDKYDTLEYSWVKTTSVSVLLRICLCTLINTNTHNCKIRKAWRRRGSQRCQIQGEWSHQAWQSKGQSSVARNNSGPWAPPHHTCALSRVAGAAVAPALCVANAAPRAPNPLLFLEPYEFLIQIVWSTEDVSGSMLDFSIFPLRP